MTYIETHVDAFLKQLASMSAAMPKMRDLPAAMARQMYDGMALLGDRPAPAMATQEDRTIAGVPCRIYDPSPDDTTTRPVFVFFHGGGFVIGSLQSHTMLAAEIAHQLNMTVVAVEYRLAPEHVFPAAHDDCLAVAKAVADNHAGLNHSVSGLILGGDSAGGNLAAALSLALKSRVKAQLLLYPVTDFVGQYQSGRDFASGFILEAEDMLWFERSYVPESAIRSDVRLSPLLDDVSGAPPAVIITCGLDPLRDQGKAYADKLMKAGVHVDYTELAGHPHACFQLRAAMPLAQAALVDALKHIKALLS